MVNKSVRLDLINGMLFFYTHLLQTEFRDMIKFFKYNETTRLLLIMQLQDVLRIDKVKNESAVRVPGSSERVAATPRRPVTQRTEPKTSG